ncbi:hypothetical protein PR048_029886 [Dryococelus australis]|uniref:Uncharacterized protein n=1 Tax=Dryococelus australis TaxID=614101 RepID=A0ABQ9G7F0_9NEOP|nr:hypothetical protein PR048_029886 [Dryococelus australis]
MFVDTREISVDLYLAFPIEASIFEAFRTGMEETTSLRADCDSVMMLMKNLNLLLGPSEGEEGVVGAGVGLPSCLPSDRRLRWWWGCREHQNMPAWVCVRQNMEFFYHEIYVE